MYVTGGTRMRQGDGYILLLLILVTASWLATSLKRWMSAPAANGPVIESDQEVPLTEAVELLEREGYEVMTRKRKIPLRIVLDDKEEMDSRLFIDHFASREGNLYIVKLARERTPLDWSASGLRDALLVYQALYREASGILYVDTELGSIRTIQFDIGI
jgi:hypothetical protein